MIEKSEVISAPFVMTGVAAASAIGVTATGYSPSR
jgi:hypothetical protein